MKSSYLLLGVFVFQLVGCSASGVSKQSAEPKGSDHNIVTIDDLSLQYSVSKTSDYTKLCIQADDPVMIARIMALGLTIAFDKPINGIKSISYPIGFLERRFFNSSNELRQFWSDTNTPQIRKSRMERVQKIAKVESKKEETYSRVDAIDGINVQLHVNNQSLNYLLILPRSELKTSSAEIKIGQLYVSPRINHTIGIQSRFSLHTNDYMSSFRSNWVLIIPNLNGK